ncbi:hypothetical protein AB0F88_21650 [Streptosporangium sp. NPDC023963]|uniref:hypothetical protein n=1 Tax=Streptosporangium sp. NPDC023963 TaxID=3155608 RepID=UPI0034222AAD
MLITVRVAVILGFAFVAAVLAATLMVADGNSWPKALFAAGAAFGAVLTVANTFIGPST